MHDATESVSRELEGDSSAGSQLLLVRQDVLRVAFVSNVDRMAGLNSRFVAALDYFS